MRRWGRPILKRCWGHTFLRLLQFSLVGLVAVSCRQQMAWEYEREYRLPALALMDAEEERAFPGAKEPDSKYQVAVDAERNVKVYSDNGRVRALDTPPAAYGVFDEDRGQIVVACADATIRMFDAATLKPLGLISSMKIKDVLIVRFGDGNSVELVRTDGTVIVWRKK